MTTFISNELVLDYFIFKDRVSGQYCAVEKRKWEAEYRFDEKRFVGDVPLMIEVELLEFDTNKNEYFRTGKTRIIEHFDLKGEWILEQKSLP